MSDDLGDQVETLLDLTKEDVTNLIKRFAKFTGNRQIIMGMAMEKKIHGLVYYAKDLRRIGKTIDLSIGEDAFMLELWDSMEREEARQHKADPSITTIAEPGKLKGVADWVSWLDKFFDMLAVLKCPQEGAAFTRDNQQVHSILCGLCDKEEPSGVLKAANVFRFQDGRRTLGALIQHYDGPGGRARGLAEAKKLEGALHYRNEKSMPFEAFQRKCGEMFSLYEKYGEPWTERRKIQYLLDRCAEGFGNDLHVRRGIMAQRANEDESLPYTAVANELATAVSLA